MNGFCVKDVGRLADWHRGILYITSIPPLYFPGTLACPLAVSIVSGVKALNTAKGTV